MEEPDSPWLAADLVKKLEGLRLKAYQDDVGKWTVGYGQTGPSIKRGVVWTREYAEERLVHYLQAQADVLFALITAPVSLSQFQALMALVYNIGSSEFAKSTLLRKLNAGDYDGAADEFLRWNKGRDRETGKVYVIEGLSNRRAAERALFLRE